MSELIYTLSEDEQSRLKRGLLAAYAVPLLDDVEDFVWEVIFHYVKGIPLYEPITEGRKKTLFDVVAPDGTGWSLKTLLWSRLNEGAEFEFVIQRADVFTKAILLGFVKGLSVQSAVSELGSALVKHWNKKYERDLQAQKVRDPRIAILLKNRPRREFAYIEMAYPPLKEEDYTWKWAREDGRGLKGQKEGRVHFKWYHSQKQLFQVVQIPREAYLFKLDWKRVSLDAFVAKMGEALGR